MEVVIITDLPINILKMIINKNKLPVNGELKEFNKVWNNTLDALIKSCSCFEDVPMNVFKMYIGIIKDNM